jgi:hypothetical protein
LKFTIFYSWQSDLPNSTNRGFIEGELDAVAKEFKAEEAVVVEVDRDTSGVSGSPDIGKTILEKIDAADSFVADVSIINAQAQDQRRAPNPNVLFELGWAFKSLGQERVLMVMNTAFGGPEDLPFDLKQRRTVKYSLPEGSDKAAARKSLRGQLRDAIKAVVEAHRRDALASTPAAPDRAAPALEAIRNARASQDVEAKAFVQGLAEDLDKLAPHAVAGDPAENLVKAIERSRSIVDDFGRVAQAAAAERSPDAVHGLVQGMEHLLKRYQFRQMAGSFRESDFDLFKFLGHELTAVLAGHLIKAERWSLVGSLFSEQIHHNDLGERPQPVGIDRLSAHALLLGALSKKEQKISVHADLLKGRHEAEPPVGGLAFEDVLAGDLMLFLGTYDPEHEYSLWYPRSAPYLGRRLPRFLSATTTLPASKNLATALQKEDLEVMKAHVGAAWSFLGKALQGEGIWVRSSFEPNQIVTT